MNWKKEYEKEGRIIRTFEETWADARNCFAVGDPEDLHHDVMRLRDIRVPVLCVMNSDAINQCDTLLLDTSALQHGAPGQWLSLISIIHNLGADEVMANSLESPYDPYIRLWWD